MKSVRMRIMKRNGIEKQENKEEGSLLLQAKGDSLQLGYNTRKEDPYRKKEPDDSE